MVTRGRIGLSQAMTVRGTTSTTTSFAGAQIALDSVFINDGDEDQFTTGVLQYDTASYTTASGGGVLARFTIPAARGGHYHRVKLSVTMSTGEAIQGRPEIFLNGFTLVTRATRTYADSSGFSGNREVSTFTVEITRAYATGDVITFYMLQISGQNLGMAGLTDGTFAEIEDRGAA